MNPIASESDSRRVGRRLLVFTPFLALMASGVFLCAMAPLAWDKGQVIGLSDWSPTATALIISLAPLIVGGIYLKSIFNRTSDDFETSVLQLIGGLIIFAAAITTAVGVGFTLIDREFYDSMRDDNGAPTLTTRGLVGQAIVGAIIMGGILAIGGYATRQAITPILHRFDRPSDEPDAMGMIMRDAR